MKELLNTHAKSIILLLFYRRKLDDCAKHHAETKSKFNILQPGKYMAEPNFNLKEQDNKLYDVLVLRDFQSNK